MSIRMFKLILNLDKALEKREGKYEKMDNILSKYDDIFERVRGNQSVIEKKANDFDSDLIQQGKSLESFIGSKIVKFSECFQKEIDGTEYDILVIYKLKKNETKFALVSIKIEFYLKN